MEKLKSTMAFLIVGLLILPFISTVASPIPPIPMTIYGHVFIHRVGGENVTAPAGLKIYAKVGMEILQPVEGSQDVTDENGYYCIGITGLEDGTLVDLWVKSVYVRTVTFHDYTTLELNLTVVDTTPPTIEIISPTPGETLSPNQPIWINATLEDNFALNAATIMLTLNVTELTPSYNTETGMLYCQTSPLAAGHYTINLSVEDLAGNSATETWNFTVESEAVPPTIEILNPTAANPAYVRAGRPFELRLRYTELNPLNGTIKIYNATYTVLQESNQTAITPGTDVILTASITIPGEAPDGSYDLSIAMFNIYNLSTTATQTNAVIIDNTNPKVTITYPAGGSYLSTKKVWINGTITETNVGAQTPTINDTRFTLQIWNSLTGQFAYLNSTALPDSQITVEVSFTDLAQNTASATVAFTLDTTKPSISNPYQEPPGQVVQPGETVEVEVGYNITVKVNVTELNLEKVSLYYNISATEWREIQMNPTTGNQYTATIPSSSFAPCTTIYYYIVAVDKAGNTAQTPVAGVYFKTHIIPEFTMLTIIVALLAFTVAIAAKGKNKTRP